MYKSDLIMELITENGNKITEFNKDGLVYVEGRKGSKYKIKVSNHTNRRIKAIISVDGLDIVSGKRATPNSGGYVLNAYQTQIFDGWRISDNEIRGFFFTKTKNTYNAKSNNDTNNIGVIGILAYKEVPFYTTVTHQINSGILDTPRNGLYNAFSVDASMMFGSSTASLGPIATASAVPMNAAQPKATRSVGTGMGEIKTSKVTKVQANWEDQPFSNIEIFYKTKRELEAMGIIVAPAKEKQLPSAFAGYCKQV